MKYFLITFICIITFSVNLSAKLNEKRCIPCHGEHWEKRAWNISKIVADMSHSEIENALKLYKKGNYDNSKTKSVMKAQVEQYSDNELEEFSKTIGR